MLDEETGLAYNRFRYYDSDSGNYISQDPIRLAGAILNFYAYVNDPNEWIDEYGLHFGSGKGRHTATVNVYNSDGSLASSQVLKSGNMTPAEQALGFPQASLATHTEARATKNVPLSNGQRMEILGQYPPCSSYQGKMRGTTNGSGSIIEYKWTDDGGKLQIMRYYFISH